MRARIGLLAAIACALLVAAPTAGAAEATDMTQVVPVTGKTQSGKRFTGTYAIDSFSTSRGRVVALGTLRGKLGNQRVARRNVAMPAVLSTVTQSAQVPPLPNSCQILNLVLGPINLNLLGLVVRTNQINLRIDAQPGPGNLLGNLLCAITGLLDPQAIAVRDLAAALNAILALVPRTG